MSVPPQSNPHPTPHRPSCHLHSTLSSLSHLLFMTFLHSNLFSSLSFHANSISSLIIPPHPPPTHSYPMPSSCHSYFIPSSSHTTPSISLSNHIFAPPHVHPTQSSYPIFILPIPSADCSHYYKPPVHRISILFLVCSSLNSIPIPPNRSMPSLYSPFVTAQYTTFGHPIVFHPHP